MAAVVCDDVYLGYIIWLTFRMTFNMTISELDAGKHIFLNIFFRR